MLGSTCLLDLQIETMQVQEHQKHQLRKPLKYPFRYHTCGRKMLKQVSLMLKHLNIVKLIQRSYNSFQKILYNKKTQHLKCYHQMDQFLLKELIILQTSQMHQLHLERKFLSLIQNRHILELRHKRINMNRRQY